MKGGFSLLRRRKFILHTLIVLYLGICEIDNGWLSFSVRSKKPNSLKEKYCYLHAAYSLFPLPFKQPIPKYSSKQAFQEPCLANLLPISQGCIIKSEIFACKILTLYLCALLQDQVSISFFHLFYKTHTKLLSNLINNAKNFICSTKLLKILRYFYVVSFTTL